MYIKFEHYVDFKVIVLINFIVQALACLASIQRKYCFYVLHQAIHSYIINLITIFKLPQ